MAGVLTAFFNIAGAITEPPKTILNAGLEPRDAAVVTAKLRYQAAQVGRRIRIDAQGFNPRNLQARTAFGCVGARRDQESIGVISALADADEVSEIITAFDLKRIIITGLDMTTASAPSPRRRRQAPYSPMSHVRPKPMRHRRLSAPANWSNFY